MISPGSNPTTIRAKTQAVTDNSTLIATDAFVQNIAETSQINSLTVIGHSWTAGPNSSSTGTPQFNQENMIPRLMGLLNVTSENVTHLGTGASYLTKTNGAYSGRNTGWGGVFQFVVPNSNQLIADQSTANITLPIPQPSSFVLVHGVNDIGMMGYDTTVTNMNQIRTSYKNAVRSVISRARAGSLYASYYASGTGSVTWDSTITTSGFASTAQTASNTGVAVYRSSTNGNTLTYTIPANFTGGTIAMCFLGNKQAWTNINTTMNNTDVSTVVALNAFVNTPYQCFANGDVVAWYSGGVDSGERGLITSGGGTASVTITRGFNGTSKTTHAINDEMITASPISVNFTTSGSNATITGNLALGTIGIPAQNNSIGIERTPVVKRFVCTASDAGKTIVATVSAVANDLATVDFDSVWIEAFDPQPFVVANLPRYSYGPLHQYVTEAQMTTWNSDVASVVAEFDASVQIADFDTTIHNRGGNLTTSITATQGTTGDTNPSFTITAISSTTFATLPQNTTFCIEGERILAKTITNNNNGTFTFTNCTRGYDGTTAATHAINKIVSDGIWFYSDGLHPNGYGHNVFAKLLFNAFQAYQQQTTYSLSTGNGNYSDDRQRPFLGIDQNNYLYPAVTNLVNAIGAFNTQFFTPIFIPQTCIITQVGCIITTLGASASVCRFGLYDLDKARRGPSLLIHDFGTNITQTLTGFIAVNTYQLVKPGWYYVSSCEQGSGTASTKRCMTATASAVGLSGYAGPSIATGNTPSATTWTPTNGFTQASVTGAFATTVGTLSESTIANPIVFLKVIARTWI
jgi:hypothetical protein